MARVLAGALLQLRRIRELGAAEEPHVAVVPERIHVAEGGVACTCGRVAVVQELSNIAPALAHDVDPVTPAEAARASPLPHHAYA